jgi:hypothetical protein
MTTRRGFLGAMLAAAVAPAIVRAGSLMPIYVPKAPKLLTLWGDGVHDDTAALQALIGGTSVIYHGTQYIPCNGRIVVPQATFLVNAPLVLTRDTDFNAAHIESASPSYMLEVAPDITVSNGYFTSTNSRLQDGVRFNA